MTHGWRSGQEPAGSRLIGYPYRESRAKRNPPGFSVFLAGAGVGFIACLALLWAIVGGP